MTAEEKKVWQQILESHNGDEDLAGETFIKYKCLTDLYFLGSEIFGMKFAKDEGRARLDKKFHKWLADKISKPNDVMVIVPRGHMKSAFVKLRVVQLVLINAMIRVLLLSRTAGLVEEQLGEIKHMLANPTLRRYFPDQLPEPGKRYVGWKRATANELTVKRDPELGRIPQENQVEAFGMGATITGRHYDVIVLDDVINEQNCATGEQIQKTRDYFSYLLPVLDPQGYFIVVGTRYHHADLYGTIIKNGWFGNRVYIREAIEDGKPIYGFFSLEMLAKIRSRVSPFVWSCQYMNNPIPQDYQIFPPPQPLFGRLPADEYEYYITVDPAATVEVYSDDTAIVVCAMNKQERLYVVEAIRMKVPGNEIADELLRLMVKYQPRKVGVEWGLQTSLRYIFDAKMSEYARKTNSPLNVVFEPIKIPRNISKADRVSRSLGSFVREGRLFIQENLEDLALQLEYFPRGEHDDLVDALSMQLQLIDNFRGGYWEEPLDQKIREKTFWDLFGKVSASKKPKTWEEQFVA